MKKTLTLVFDDHDDRESFIGWFLDGGGEQGLNDSREAHDEPYLNTKSEKTDWPWMGIRRGLEPDDYRILVTKNAR